MQSNNSLVFKTVWHDKVSSTNDICMDSARNGGDEGVVVAAKYQEQGRGQRGNSWESEQGLNLTFSILLLPNFLRVDEQFLISKIAAISVCDWISAYLKDKHVAIKWPNDIYIDNNKVAGILIENTFSSSTLDISVVGIGINLNQREFSTDLPNPTSLSIETNQVFDLKISLEEFLSCFNERYRQAKSGEVALIDSEYLNKLYRKDIYCTYRASNDEFKAKIVGVKPTGELMLQTEKGEERSFAFKEVVFVI